MQKTVAQEKAEKTATSTTVSSNSASDSVAPATEKTDNPHLSSGHSAVEKSDARRGLAIGQTLSNVGFQDVKGIKYSDATFRGNLSVWTFVDASCPCVKAYQQRLQTLQKRFAKRGVRFVYVFSQPGETGAQVKDFAKQQGYKGVIARDADQKLLDVFDAQCTTETFLFDRKGALRYHGRIDDNTYAPQQVKSHDLLRAIEAVAAGKPVLKPETRALACAIDRLRLNNRSAS